MKWGLRSGAFKFISNVSGEEEELYNLEQDPHEQINLAKTFPKKGNHYKKILTSWYTGQNEAYLNALKNYPKKKRRAGLREAVKNSGPINISMGLFCSGSFVPNNVFSQWDKIVISTEGIPYSEQKELIYEIVAPDGYSEKARVTHEKDWSISYFTPQWVMPFKLGMWRVRIHQKNTFLLENTYHIQKVASQNCN